jgi:membrane dipeptidase
MKPVTRREALRALAIAAAPAVLRGRYRVFAQSNAQYSARAVRLVESSVVVDLLNQFQFPDFAVKPPRIEQWLSTPGTFTPDDAARYRTSGITVFALGAGAGSHEDAVRFFARWNGFLAGYSEWLTRIDKAADFVRAKAQKKIGVMLTFQDSTHFRTPAEIRRRSTRWPRRKSRCCSRTRPRARSCRDICGARRTKPFRRWRRRAASWASP